MATFRVYLRKHGWSEIAWQFSETVVAPSSAIAVQRAFETWQNEKGSTAPASLADCDQKVDPVQ